LAQKDAISIRKNKIGNNGIEWRLYKYRYLDEKEFEKLKNSVQ